jgi:hypothetical protein
LQCTDYGPVASFGQECAIADMTPEDTFLHQNLERIAQRNPPQTEQGPQPTLRGQLLARHKSALDDEGAQLRDRCYVRDFVQVILGRPIIGIVKYWLCQALPSGTSGKKLPFGLIRSNADRYAFALLAPG